MEEIMNQAKEHLAMEAAHDILQGAFLAFKLYAIAALYGVLKTFVKS
jgi:hypothetical protein